MPQGSERTDVAQLFRNVEILNAGITEPPTEVKLLAAGKIETTKGDFGFPPESGKAVMSKAADYGNDFNFDYGHSMLGSFNLDPSEAGKAAGWYKLDLRNGELWATDIRWTPKARDMIMNREYRYISPAFCHNEAGEVTELINCALTNIPATKRLKPLMASRKTEESKMDEKEMVAALATSKAFSEEIAKLTGKAGPEALAVIQAWKVGFDRAVELTAKLEAVETAARASELDTLVKQGSSEGKIPPAMLEWAKSQSVESLKAFLSVAPALVIAPKTDNAPAPKSDASGKSEIVLTSEEKTMAKLMSMDPAKVLARKIEVAAAGPKTADVDEE